MVVLVVVAVIAGLAAAGYVGYKYGAKIEAENTAIYQAAHSRVSSKLAEVKAEVEKIEKTGYADVTSSVQRIKALL